MQRLKDKTGRIDFSTLKELLNIREERCIYKSFFNHPINLITFYPETEISYFTENNTTTILAQDNFTEYYPCLPYNDRTTQNITHKTYNIALPQLRAIAWKKRINLQDWYYIYDYKASSIKRMFHKRKNLINQSKNLPIKTSSDIPKQKDIHLLVKEWAKAKNTSNKEERIILDAQIQIQLNFYENILPKLNQIGIQTHVKGLYIQDKLIALSSAIIGHNTFTIIFESSLKSEHKYLPSLIFYEMCIEANKLSKYINTLGHDNIKGLKKNKGLYKPLYITPIYTAEPENY